MRRRAKQLTRQPRERLSRLGHIHAEHAWTFNAIWGDATRTNTASPRFVDHFASWFSLEAWRLFTAARLALRRLRAP